MEKQRLFNETMSSDEARIAFWAECENETEEKIKEIAEDYKRIVKVITKRELAEVYNGTICKIF